METLTGQLGQTGNQPATRGYNTTEPARVAGEGDFVLAQFKVQSYYLIPKSKHRHSHCDSDIHVLSSGLCVWQAAPYLSLRNDG